VLTTQWNI
jgi:hypothetical protein